MEITKELAIQLVQSRQALLYFALLLVFALVVDILWKPYKIPRKLICSVLVVCTAFARMLIEDFLGLPISVSLCVFVCAIIYTAQLTMYMVNKKHHS